MFPSSLLGAAGDISVFPSPLKHFRQSVAFDLKWNAADLFDDDSAKEAAPATADRKLYYAMYKRYGDLTEDEQQIADGGRGGYVQVVRKLNPRARKKKYHTKGQDRKCCVLMTHFDTAAEAIDILMPPLLDYLTENRQLNNKCFQVKFRSSLHSNRVLLVLYYHRKLDKNVWKTEATKLRAAFPDIVESVVGRSKGQLLTVDSDEIEETYLLDETPLTLPSEQQTMVPAQSVILAQPENCFIQPNAHVCSSMLQWARDTLLQQRQSHSDNSKDSVVDGGDLLELHCGIGTFTCALAPYFRKVLATELMPRSVEALSSNIARNNLDNITCAALSADVTVAHMETVGQSKTENNHSSQMVQFSHPKAKGDTFAFSTALVDPPRAGLDETTRNALTAFPNILYISCNPDALARDLQLLSQTHDLAAAAFFDQFPGTEHMESGVLLQRRNDSNPAPR